MRSPEHELIDVSVRFIRERVAEPCDIGLILGSGLGDYADSIPKRKVISASDIPNFPLAGVEGHEGTLVFAPHGDTRLLAFQGRSHFYESGDLAKTLYPIRVAAGLGVKTLIVTNAAGGVNRHLAPGTLMVITDQIDLTGELLSGSPPAIRHRPLYDPGLIALTESIAKKNGIVVERGVYAGMKGPSYETAAEIEMIHRLGGDAVGMSTVKEVLCASGLGMRIMGISCITNMGTGIALSPLTHGEVKEVANKVKRKFSILVSALISAIGHSPDPPSRAQACLNLE